MTTWKSLATAFTSWRVGAVALLSFSSGLPLGLFATSLTFWMSREGVDVKTIGLLTAAQAPYAFKFLWSPLVDRFAPRRGRRRVWILLGQLGLAATTFALAGQAGRPDVAAVAVLCLLIGFASATQDIAVDAYAVEALRPNEQGLAVGARTALYRAAMYVSGFVLVTLGPTVGWDKALAGLAGCYLLLAGVTVLAPDPEGPLAAPASLRSAIWEPFVGFFRQGRALEVVGFLFFYKLADNLAGALVSVFLDQKGYSAVDVGIARGSIGLFAVIGGTLLGGLLTGPLGVGRALWVFGLLQAVSNLGYVAVAELPPSRPLMYAAIAIEAATTGTGTGAFGVLMLRLTQRRYSATQFALFSSVFALGRTLSGPPAGTLVDALGWSNFFLLTVVSAVPGMLLLQRFAPWQQRDIPPRTDEAQSPEAVGTALSPLGLLGRGAVGAALGAAASFLYVTTLVALKASRQGGSFELGAALSTVLHPTRPADYIDLFTPLVVGVCTGLAVAAYLAARRGVAWR